MISAEMAASPTLLVEDAEIQSEFKFNPLEQRAEESFAIND